MGYPHKKPPKTAKEEASDTPKSGQIIGDKIREIPSTARVLTKSEVMTIKGNKVGRTVLNQSKSPAEAP